MNSLKKNYLLKYESNLWQKGLTIIAGVDEAGRGPLAGPMVVSAVILKRRDLEIVGNALKDSRNYDVLSEKEVNKYSKINDSKKLTEKRREDLYDFIIKSCEDYSVVEIPPEIIDREGITAAVQKGFKNAVINLKSRVEHILTDHVNIKDLKNTPQTNIIKGDSKSINIAAASIIAKVYRDNIMREYAKEFPLYGFERHKGYGTKLHREAILKYGPCKIHRRSFEPIKSMKIK
jgi:ribonuclease HII